MEIIRTSETWFENPFPNGWKMVAELKLTDHGLQISGYGIRDIEYGKYEITDPGYCGKCGSRGVVVDYNKPGWTRHYRVFCKNCK